MKSVLIAAIIAGAMHGVRAQDEYESDANDVGIAVTNCESYSGDVGSQCRGWKEFLAATGRTEDSDLNNADREPCDGSPSGTPPNPIKNKYLFCSSGFVTRAELIVSELNLTIVNETAFDESLRHFSESTRFTTITVSNQENFPQVCSQYCGSSSLTCEFTSNSPCLLQEACIEDGTCAPTTSPTVSPTGSPSTSPTTSPSVSPTPPTNEPSASPSASPSKLETVAPTSAPTIFVTEGPIVNETETPLFNTTDAPTSGIVVESPTSDTETNSTDLPDAGPSTELPTSATASGALQVWQVALAVVAVLAVRR